MDFIRSSSSRSRTRTQIRMRMEITHGRSSALGTVAFLISIIDYLWFRGRGTLASHAEYMKKEQERGKRLRMKTIDWSLPLQKRRLEESEWRRMTTSDLVSRIWVNTRASSRISWRFLLIRIQSLFKKFNRFLLIFHFISGAQQAASHLSAWATDGSAQTNGLRSRWIERGILLSKGK